MAPDESERYNAFLESVGYFQNKNEPDPLRLPEGLPTLVKTFPTVGRLVARHMLTLTDMDQRRQIKDSFLSMRTLVKGLAEAPAPPIPHTPATEASEGGEGEEKDEEEEGKGGEEGGEPGQAELGTSFKGIDIDFNSDLLAEVNRHIDEDDWDSESAVASYNSFLKAVGYHGTFPDAAKLIDGTEDVDALLDFLDAHELKIAPGLSVDYRPVRIWKEIIQKIRDGGIKVIQKVRNKLYPWDKTISKYEVKEEEGGGGGGGGEVSEEGVGHADEVKAGTDAAGGPDPSVDEIAPVVPEYKVDSEENKEEDVHLKQPHVSLEDINIEFENAELERVDKAVNTFDITSPEAVSSYNFFLKVIGYFKKEPNAIELPGGMRQVDSQIEFIQACKDSVAKRRPEASKPLNKLYSKLRAYLHTIKRAITPKIVGGGGKKGTVDNKPAPAEPRRKPSDAASSRPSSAYTDQFESYSSGEESSGSYHIEEEEEEEEKKKSKEDIPTPPVTYPTDADVAKLIPEPATSSVSLEDINIEFENAELERVDKAVNTFDITSPEAVSSYNFFLKVIGYFKKEPNAIELPGGMRQVDSQIEFIQACKDSVAKRRPEASKPLNKLYSKLRAYLHTIKRAITPKIVGGGGKKGTVDNKPAPAEPRRKPSDAASSRPSSAYTDQFESYSSGEESSGSYHIEEEEEEEELKEEEEEEKSKEDIPIPPVTYPTDADVAKLIPEPATSSTESPRIVPAGGPKDSSDTPRPDIAIAKADTSDPHDDSSPASSVYAESDTSDSNDDSSPASSVYAESDGEDFKVPVRNASKAKHIISASIITTASTTVKGPTPKRFSKSRRIQAALDQLEFIGKILDDKGEPETRLPA